MSVCPVRYFSGNGGVKLKVHPDSSLYFTRRSCHGHTRGSDLEPQIHLRALLCAAVGPERALPLSKARPERVSSRWICLGSASLGVDPCVAIYYGVNIYYGVPAR